MVTSEDPFLNPSLTDSKRRLLEALEDAVLNQDTGFKAQISTATEAPAANEEPMETLQEENDADSDSDADVSDEDSFSIPQISEIKASEAKCSLSLCELITRSSLSTVPKQWFLEEGPKKSLPVMELDDAFDWDAILDGVTEDVNMDSPSSSSLPEERLSCMPVSAAFDPKGKRRHTSPSELGRLSMRAMLKLTRSDPGCKGVLEQPIGSPNVTPLCAVAADSKDEVKFEGVRLPQIPGPGSQPQISIGRRAC